MPNQHALLSPSSSERWLHCPKSVRLSEQFEDTTSVYASEGTEAHALCEHLVLTALGRHSTDPRSWFKQYSQEMQEAAEGYTAYIMETVAALRQDGVEPSVFVEQRLDMRSYVKDCFGTSDCVIIGGDTIVICDFKFGKLPVPATSPQLRIYALGACELFGKRRWAEMEADEDEDCEEDADDEEIDVPALLDHIAQSVNCLRWAFGKAGVHGDQ